MQEWYLMNSNTRPNATGGYENDGFIEWKEDSFYETLDTDIATTVILYNHDLSESRTIRCIIQGNTSDTQLKSMERSILVPIGTLKAGNYIFYENEYWLVNGRPGNNKIYEKAVIIECQYLLKWQNSKGDIIERWVNLTSASKYDVGENAGRTIILTSNNYTILIPSDIESFGLDRKRVFIDLHPTNPTRVFKITRTDDPLYNYNSHGGVLSLIADKIEFNPETDNQELRICDYIDPFTLLPSSPSNPDETTVSITPHITHKGNAEIKIGGNYKTFTGYFDNKDGVQTSDVGKWEVIAIDELLPYIEYVITNNVLKIKVLDNDFASGKIRIIFSSINVSTTAYLDLNIVNSF